ncbi:hypothetical protein JCM10908_004162 [Rhodotorula pacifica]|uniref:uncharacterized protein n=1 Tax=Rhodotorula pacifica TaxID=1495444 RepID=UPI00317D752D
MLGPRWAPSRPDMCARRATLDENPHVFFWPPTQSRTSLPARPVSCRPNSPPEPPPKPKPKPGIAGTLSHDVLSRIFDHATDDLSLDQHHVKLLAKVNLVCKRWRQAAGRNKVVTVSNYGRSDWRFEGSQTGLRWPTLATRLSLRVVLHDRQGGALIERTVDEIEAILKLYKGVTHLRVDVASLPVQVLFRLPLPDITHVELFNSKPRLRSSSSWTASSPSSTIQPRSLRIESGVSSHYIRHLARVGSLDKVLHLAVSIDLDERLNEDFHLADFGSLSLERLELGLKGALRLAFNYHCCRQRLYAAVRALAPRRLRLEAVSGRAAEPALSELLAFLATAGETPVSATSKVVQLSVKGRAAASSSWSPSPDTLPSRIAHLTVVADRPSSSKGLGPERRKLITAVCAVLARMESSDVARTVCLPVWMREEARAELDGIQQTKLRFFP